MSPKTITGAELELDDGPARDAELFLVDGNNLAYRAFFALPEELATSDGMPTNALLGFGNMLFKLLADYKPRGVAVAWDTRPVHRTAVAEAVDVVYKEGRKPMPDLLREQFPHFRPIVEAFGYRNLEFEGWEADDVIATIATRADEAGVKTCVVSTDRDAFQLCSRERDADDDAARRLGRQRLHARSASSSATASGPTRCPTSSASRATRRTTSPAFPGSATRRPASSIAQYGSLEEVIAHADELSPARGKAVREHADQARASKELATMRRDLPLDVDPTTLVSGSPDRSQLKEMFRRFEFRGLLNRVDELDTALPAQERPKLEGQAVGWREEPLAATRGRVGVAIEERPDRGRLRTTGSWSPTGTRRRRNAAPRRRARRSRRQGVAPAVRADRRHDARGVPDRARSLGVSDRRSRGRVRPRARAGAAAEETTASLVRHAEATRRLAAPMRERLVERGSLELYENIELPLTAVLAAMEDAGVKIDTYRMGEITARLKDRVEELEALATNLAGEEFMLGSTQQVARILFEKLGLAPGRKGKTGLLDRQPRAARDARRARDRAGDRGVARVLEAAQHLSPAAAVADLGARRSSAHDVQPGGRRHRAPVDDESEPAVDPDPDRPRPPDPLGVHRRGRASAGLGGLQPGRAAHPRARLRRAGAA